MDNKYKKIEIKFENDDCDTFTNNEDLSENGFETLSRTVETMELLIPSSNKQEDIEHTLEVIKDENVTSGSKICWDNFPEVEDTYMKHMNLNHMLYDECDFKEHKPELNHSLTNTEDKETSLELNEDSSLDSSKVLNISETSEKAALKQDKSKSLLYTQYDSNNRCTMLNEINPETWNHNENHTTDNVTETFNTTVVVNNDLNMKLNNMSNTVIGHILLEDKKYVCKICQRHFKNNSSYLRHVRSHTGEKPYSCVLCTYKCATNTMLTQHMKKHTGEDLFYCEICPLKFVRKYDLVLHMRRHTGDKPYDCKLCDQRFVSRTTLNNHMKIHTGEKPFSCRYCGYKCSRNSYLVFHMRTHTGEKPYMCKFCEFKCSQHSGLVNHIKSHTRQQTYSCNFCQFKCLNGSGLASHMRTHIGENPYIYEYCDYRCAFKSSLVRHMETHSAKKPHCDNDYKYDNEIGVSGNIRIYKRKN